ncbi:MAG: hypothetical protein IJE25_07680 [Clostridia bacterium]|nr:hypothetical protein [Clostridia bacterium]
MKRIICIITSALMLCAIGLLCFTACGECKHIAAVDDGDCTTALICTDCNAVIAAAGTHDFSGELEGDTEGHFRVCLNKGCAAEDGREAHDGEAQCTACGFVFLELHPDGTSSITVSNVFEQTESEDSSAVNGYTYMFGEVAEDGETVYKHVYSIIAFRVENSSNKEIVLDSVKLRLVDGNGNVYPIASREVSAEWGMKGNRLAYRGTYNEIGVTVGKTLEKGEVFVGYAVALSLPDGNAFRGKQIEVMVKTSEHEFVSSSLDCGILAEINPDNEYSFTEGMTHTFHAKTCCYAGCTFVGNDASCTECGNLCESIARDGRHNYVGGVCACGDSLTPVSNLDELKAAVERGGKILLTESIDVSSEELGLYLYTDFTVYLNGKTLTGDLGIFNLLRGATLTILGDGTLSVPVGNCAIGILNGTVNIAGGVIEGSIIANENGKLNIRGGQVRDANVQKGICTVSGGTFGFDPAEYVDTEIYTVTDNGDGTWTVTAK